MREPEEVLERAVGRVEGVAFDVEVDVAVVGLGRSANPRSARPVAGACEARPSCGGGAGGAACSRSLLELLGRDVLDRLGALGELRERRDAGSSQPLDLLAGDASDEEEAVLVVPLCSQRSFHAQRPQ